MVTWLPNDNKERTTAPAAPLRKMIELHFPTKPLIAVIQNPFHGGWFSNDFRGGAEIGCEARPPAGASRPPHRDAAFRQCTQRRDQHEKYRVIRDLLSAHARIARVIAYHVALRKGAIRKIRSEWVDLKKKRIELPFRAAENKGVPPFVPIYEDMVADLDNVAQHDQGLELPILDSRLR
jgi:hypothetical protein